MSYSEPQIASITHSQRIVRTGPPLYGRDLQGERPVCSVPHRECDVVLSGYILCLSQPGRCICGCKCQVGEGRVHG